MLRVELAPSSIRSVFTLQHAHDNWNFNGSEIYRRALLSRTIPRHARTMLGTVCLDACLKVTWRSVYAISRYTSKFTYRKIVLQSFIICISLLYSCETYINLIIIKSNPFCQIAGRPSNFADLPGSIWYICIENVMIARNFYRGYIFQTKLPTWNRAPFSDGSDGEENLLRLTRTRQFSRFFCPCTSLLCPN